MPRPSPATPSAPPRTRERAPSRAAKGSRAAGVWSTGAKAYVRKGRGASLQPTVVQLPSRPSNDFTAKARRRAIEAADAGQLRLAADLTHAALNEFGVYAGVVSTIAHGILGLPLNFHGPPELVAALLDCEGTPGDFGRQFPESEAAQVFTDGVILGVGLGQLIEPERREMGTRAVPRLRYWDPRFLRQEPYSRRWFLRTANGGEVEIRPGDGEWILFTPYGEVEPWRNAPWIFLTLAFVFARDAAFDRQRHSEVNGPVRVMRAQKPTTKEARKKALYELDHMQRDNRFVLPEPWIYEVVEAKGDVAAIYAAIIDWAERQVVIGLTGQTITTDGGKGFITEGTIHQRIARDKLRFYATTWFRTLREQALSWWAWENFGAAHPPTGGYNVDPPEDVQARAAALTGWAQALIQLADAALKHGLKVSPAWVIEEAQKRGIKLEAAQAEQVLDEVAPPAPPPANDEAADDQEPPSEPDDEHAARLADEMTAHGMAACEHGYKNRCPRCGVERLRGVELGPDGKPRWKRGWRPIKRAPESAVA